LYTADGEEEPFSLFNITAWRYNSDGSWEAVINAPLPCLGTLGISMVTDGVPAPRLYAGCSNGSTFEYDLGTDTLRTIKHIGSEAPSRFVGVPSMPGFVYGLNDDLIYKINVKTLTAVMNTSARSDSLVTDGSWLYTVSMDDARVMKIDPRTLQVIATLPLGTNFGLQMAPLPGGKGIAMLARERSHDYDNYLVVDTSSFHVVVNTSVANHGVGGNAVVVNHGPRLNYVALGWARELFIIDAIRGTAVGQVTYPNCIAPDRSICTLSTETLTLAPANAGLPFDFIVSGLAFPKRGGFSYAGIILTGTF